MYDFQAAMADGKARAQRERNRGRSSSVRVVSTEELYMGMTEEDWQSWQDELADAVDATSAGDGMDETEEEAPKPPRKTVARPAGARQPPKISGGAPMAAKAYVTALAKLHLSPYSAAPHLGISRAMSFRYAAGSHAIPATVAKLVRALVLLGKVDV